jgi:diguanylate cyclase (GGDEF)-like protein/PAS domain S-box-containing protein
MAWRLALGPETPLLLLVDPADEAIVDRGRDAGATDFAMRRSPPTLLVHRVRQMLHVKHAVDELRRSESSLAHAQRIARLGNWTWDPIGDAVTWSAEVSRLLGVPPGMHSAPMDMFLTRVHREDRAKVRGAFRDVLAGDGTFALDLRFVQAGGRIRDLQAQGEAVYDAHGRATRVMGTLQDITERMATEERIRFLAYYDSLTSLPNRVLFTERLRGMIGAAKRRGHMVATVFVDLDNIKGVNDTMGHTAGDELLKTVAARFRDTIRDTDLAMRDQPDPHAATSTVARLGGDEFILAIGELDRVEDVPRIARRLQESLKQPIPLSPFGEVFVTTSMGISVYPQDGQTVEELFKNADAALYHAKDSGRNCFQFFSASLNEAALQRLLLEGHLRRAVENGELLAYFQPQVDGRTDQVVAVEALMRWNRPETGLVPPAQFIHVAEESGSIHELGRWILRTASAEAVARRWPDRGVKVSVNISPAQFKRPDVVETLVEAVTSAGLSPDAVALEITETSIMRDPDASVARLQQIRALGVRVAVDDFGTGYSSLTRLKELPAQIVKVDRAFVAGVGRDPADFAVARAVPTLRGLKDAGFSIVLDDFGTGYSSLTYLKALPLDALKIDRSFIRNLTTDARDAAIVTAIIGVARSLSMNVVAEGVEHPAQKRKLLELGCPIMQGYLFGRPVHVDQLDLARTSEVQR